MQALKWIYFFIVLVGILICNFTTGFLWRGGYVDYYTLSPEIKPITDRDACANHCLLYSITQPKVFAITADGSTCYCVTTSRQTSTLILGSVTVYSTILLYRPVFDTLNTTLIIGEEHTFHITLLEFKVKTAANQVHEIKVIKDLSTFEAESSIQIISADDDFKTAIEPERELIRNAKTKIFSSLRETFVTESNSYICSKYELKVKVLQNGMEDGDHLWMSSVYKTDEFIMLDLQKYTVEFSSKPKNCIAVANAKGQMNNSVFQMVVQLEMSSDCNTDMSKVAIEVNSDDLLKALSVDFFEDGFETDDIVISDSKATINYKTLLAGSKIHLAVEFGGKNTVSKHVGIKEAVVHCMVRWENVADNIKTPASFKAYEKVLVGDTTTEVFYLRSEKFGYCFKFDEKTRKLVTEWNQCTFFKYVSRGLQILAGDYPCLQIGPSSHTINCRDRKERIIMNQRNVFFLERKKYLASSKTVNTPATESTTTDDILITRQYYRKGTVTQIKDNCDLRPGKGTGGSHVNLGLKTTRACYEECEKLRLIKYPLLNGISTKAVGSSKGECVCQLEMNGFDDDGSWNSCVYRQEPVSPHDVISILVNKNKFYVCSSIKLKDGKCLQYNITDSSVTDNSDHIYLFNKDSAKIKRRIVISERTFEMFKAKPNFILAKSYDRGLLETEYSPELIDENGITYVVSYYGLLSVDSGQHIIIWPAEEGRCKVTAGKSAFLAMPSCKEIKRYCKTTDSGFYWVTGQTNVKKYVFCDMDTDEGGWLMITNYTITNSQYIGIVGNAVTDIGDVALSNFTKFLESSQGFAPNLRSYYQFTQIRFYCRADHPGRTFHIQILPDPSIYPHVFSVFTSQSANNGPTLDYVEVYDDDDSQLSRLKSRWGQRYTTYGCNTNQVCVTSTPHAGVFGNMNTYQQSLYKNPIHELYGPIWYIGFDNKMICDTKLADPGRVKEGVWKIYVR